jgi:transcriptional regulator with XRE-family HTH domain
MVTGISRGTIARAKELLELETSDVARAVGCTTGTLNRWRRGVQDPSPRHLEQLELLDDLLHQLLDKARTRQRVRAWFDGRVPALGNHRPREIFLTGNLAHLVVYLRRLERL